MAFSYIGATIGCVVGVPATVDAAGFAAQAHVLIGEIVEWGELGDTSADIASPRLSSRTTHVNGAIDGGEVTFTVGYAATDAGQIILLAQSNGQAEVSFEVTDPDGEKRYFYGKVANVRDLARNTTNEKGLSGVVRINSPLIRVAAP